MKKRENREKRPNNSKEIDERRVMTLYEHFEQTIAMVLSGVIAVIIVISLARLIHTVFVVFFVETFNPLDHGVFQTVFGMIMTLLIAMEFKHSILKVAMRRDSIIQVKTVVLIAIIAMGRKLVILDPETSPAKVASIAGATLALGIVHRLLREREDRLAQEEGESREG